MNAGRGSGLAGGARAVGRGGRRRGRRRRGDAGQTVTEYLMIVGFLTALIIALMRLIIPAVAHGILGYLEQRVVYVSTVGDGALGERPTGAAGPLAPGDERDVRTGARAAGIRGA